MGIALVVVGPKGRVAKLIRHNGKCPADEFFKHCVPKMAKRFQGSFAALTQMGASYANFERFKPLRDQGKPLWEFKEHDKRLYCVRIVVGESVTAVLLNGWEKDKEGRTGEEDREIQRAQRLKDEITGADLEGV